MTALFLPFTHYSFFHVSLFHSLHPYIFLWNLLFFFHLYDCFVCSISLIIYLYFCFPFCSSLYIFGELIIIFSLLWLLCLLHLSIYFYFPFIIFYNHIYYFFPNLYDCFVWSIFFNSRIFLFSICFIYLFFFHPYTFFGGTYLFPNWYNCFVWSIFFN